MEDFTAILEKSVNAFMVSEDLEFIKFIVIVFLVLGCFSMLKDLLRGRRSRSARILKQIRKQQKDEYEKMEDQIDRELVLLEPETPKFQPKESRQKDMQNYFKKNDAYVRLFYMIDETMSYGRVCELLGMEGVLQAQIGLKSNYIWYLGKQDDEGYYIEQVNKAKGDIKFIFCLLALIPAVIAVSLGLNILLTRLLLCVIAMVIFCVLFDFITDYFVSLFQLKRGSSEDIYIRVSFVDDKVCGKEQKGLRPRE